ALKRAWCTAVLCVTLAHWGTLGVALTVSLRRPQYYEIYKHGTVIGISLPFMTIDLLGGVFSILSLVFKRQVDALAAVAYVLVYVTFLADGVFA
ncbi:hypothetical protein F5148DRAFT_1158824, partial [Russula earlei]